MTLKTKITTAIVTGSFLAGIVMPAGAFAANNVTISGNGVGSYNKVKIKSHKRTTARQTNTAAVVNLTGAFQNTGGNNANGNTGDGDVTVDTGKATSAVTNTTTIGGNAATVNGCGCPAGDNTVNVKNNGVDSYNKVVIKNSSNTTATQNNTAFVLNGTLVAQNTGDNNANGNTGSGSVEVTTGDADSTVTNTTTVAGNALTVTP